MEETAGVGLRRIEGKAFSQSMDVYSSLYMAKQDAVKLNYDNILKGKVLCQSSGCAIIAMHVLEVEVVLKLSI